MNNEKWLLGIDIGGTSVKLAFVTEAGDILYKWEIPTNTENQGKTIISEIGAAVSEKLTELNETKEKLKAAGVGALGPDDTEEGLLLEPVHVGWQGTIHIRDLVQQQV